MSDEDFAELEAVASPGAGACGGQFTANTMAMAFEVLGISPDGPEPRPRPGRRPRPRSPTRPAGWWSTSSGAACARATSSPSEALENAIAGVACSGGSTNARPAPARGRPRDRRRARHRRLRPHQPSARRCCATSSPAASYVAVDLYEAGGVAGHAPAPAGGRAAQRGRDHRHRADDRRAGRARPTRPRASASCAALDDPLKATGGLAILRGNLAPEGCVVKLAGHERRHHDGPARVFDGEEAAMRRGHRAARSRPATSSSSATRARPAARACARCSPSPARSTAPAWARTSRCSPTGASPAPRTASWSATSRPRRRAAARSPPSATATSSPSTSTSRRMDVDARRRRDRAPRRRLRAAARTPTAPACWPSTRALVGSASEGAVTACA